MNDKMLQAIRREAREYVEDLFDELEMDYTEHQLEQAVQYLSNIAEYVRAGHRLALGRIVKEEE